MKKFLTCVLATMFLGALAIFAACDPNEDPTPQPEPAPQVTEEENFAAAVQAFDNYTASVEMTVKTPAVWTYSHEVEICGTKGKAVLSINDQTITLFMKEEAGKVFVWTETRRWTTSLHGSVLFIDGWNEAKFSTMEDAVAFYADCYLAPFQTLEYSDMTPGTPLSMNEAGMQRHSEGLGGIHIDTATIVLTGNRITSAHVTGTNQLSSSVSQYDLSYTFSAYGTTSVTLPE